ncbi:MAG: hypothetical protein JEZ09_14600 [Salinivirgaceae bacterium]|nr:hypothetical protein [Salinivirgaceae bacterium]
MGNQKMYNQNSNESSYSFTDNSKVEKISLNDTGWIQPELNEEFNNYLEEYD